MYDNYLVISDDISGKCQEVPTGTPFARLTTVLESARMADSKKREGKTQISVWCEDPLVEKIDERKAEMQKGQRHTINRSDVIRAVLRKEFGLPPLADE
jgi:hypothetical protein